MRLKKKGLSCTFLPENVFRISSPKISHYFKGTSLPCNNKVAASLSCNKYFLRRLLQKENIPAPRTIILRHKSAWQTVLTSSLRFPLVVKPIDASHANGASLHITTPKELQLAVIRAFDYIKMNKRDGGVLVEEYFTGHDLRLLVVGDEVVSVVKRDPAYVVGDGLNTIRQLIRTFNDQWRSPLKYDLPLCPIPIDNEVSRYLAKSKLTLGSVLSRGKKTYLRWNANVSTGGRPNDLTDKINPCLKRLAVRIARLSDLAIGGVDILCQDYTSSDITANNIAVLEINDSPGLDIHHFPVTGPGQDVSTAIMNYIFDELDGVAESEPHDIETLLGDLQIMPTKTISVVSGYQVWREAEKR